MPPKEFTFRYYDPYGGIIRIRYVGRRSYLPLSLSYKLPLLITIIRQFFQKSKENIVKILNVKNGEYTKTNALYKSATLYSFLKTTMCSFVIVDDFTPLSLVGELSEGITLLMIFLSIV